MFKICVALLVTAVVIFVCLMVHMSIVYLGQSFGERNIALIFVFALLFLYVYIRLDRNLR